MNTNGNTRLAYIRYSYLKYTNPNEDTKICYVPMCRICRSWVLYQIVVVRGGCHIKRKFICMNCAIKVYPKRYLISLINSHISGLSRNTKHKASLLKAYIHTKRMVERARLSNRSRCFNIKSTI
jgi:superfamily II helicase